MEDHRTVTKLLSVNAFMATIDLKEAYFLVPIAKSCRKYLCFAFDGKIYHFNVLPYGLSVAPRIFTKIMKEVMNHLRSKGYRSVIYLDDILCIGDTFSECVRNVTETLNLLERLCFVVNWEKSMLLPQQNCRFLGFTFNTVEMSLGLPVDKRNKISKLINIYLTLPKCTIREFSQLIGVLVAACPAIKYGWLYTRSLERAKFLALQQNDDYSTKIKLSKDILPDLRWWNNNITSSNNSLRPQDQFMLEIFSDASKTGWGAFCNGNRVNGGWKDSELSLHINYLELLAVFMGLKCFAKNLSNGSILLRVDNTTAICYINRMGGIQFPHLNDLARSIWQWCEKRNIWLFASYINSQDNIEADQESRKLNIDIEWELSTWAFNNIKETLGTPDIDLFASRVNAKCQRYISWKKDPDAISSPVAPDPYPGSCEALRYAFKHRNVPSVALDLMISSISANTLRQYNVSLKLWWQFCLEQSLNVLDTSIESVITFLTSQFYNGSSYGTINTHRSALSLFLGNHVGSDERIKRLLKGIFKQKPCRPKYITTWNPQVVLDYISQWVPNKTLSLERLTKKVTVLLALCTAHRVQTLSLIKIENIIKSSDGIKILITDLIKTSSAGKEQPHLYLPFFKENPNICPAMALEDYMYITKDLRPPNTKTLLITYKKPYRKASSQTISRWIKQTLAEGGVDVGVFSAHSTRHASTSAAASAGVCIDVKLWLLD
ncbi:uncharacterized protein LOC123654470 [Melitaea cinxia]|uniref:uncharacterized protein LOC123654470 n=1 Tax=Melitaea cinxia TaxID=113334 RepID=UPI001E272C68|nr:uncharacterized protein LOC123654470 [Melitaea cinxia]